MSHGDCPNIISVLPPEILKHILSYLSYPFLQSIRPTSKVINAAAVDLLSEGLHTLRLKVDKASVKFLKATWLKADLTGNASVLTYAKRLSKGSGSLVMLAGLIRAADVCSRRLVQVRALPPLPGTVLQEILSAVNIATWRNPLVGVNRLRDIYRHLLVYFTHNRILNANALPPVVVFRTVLDVLQNMPKLTTNVHMELTDQAVCLSCTVPPICVKLQHIGGASSTDTDNLILKLVQLSIHVVERYILTSQVHDVIGNDPVSEHDGYISNIQLTVPYVDVPNVSFQNLRQLEPQGFFVTLSGFKITTPLDLADLEEKEEINLNYSF